MSKFVYRAYSPRGVLEERTVRGDTVGLVTRDLSERGYRVLALRPAKSGWRWLYRQMPTFFRGKTSDTVQFSRLLATFPPPPFPSPAPPNLLRAPSNTC